MPKDRSIHDDDMTEQPTTTDILSRLTSAIELLATRQTAAPDADLSGIMGKLTDALTAVSKAQVEGAQIIATETRRAHRPSNEVVPMISVFNRRGETLADYQKPRLKCIMLLPWLAEWESLTREEVELLNLLEAGEYNMKRIDDSMIKVTVNIEYHVNGTASRLLLNHDTGFNNDNFRMVPSLHDMLRGLLRQHRKEVAEQARLIMSDEEEALLIAAKELTVAA